MTKNVPSEKIEVIYNGISFESGAAQPVGLVDSQKKWVIEGTAIVTAVANLILSKGIQHLLRAATVVIAKHPKTRFLLVGEGPYQTELELMTHDLGLDSNVIFLGRRSDVPEILRTSTMLVLPSLKESLSNVTIEAMGAGLPVVASRIGGIPELVDDMETGILVSPGDSAQIAEAIIWLIEHPEQRDEMGERGRVKVMNNFTLERSVDKHIDFIHRAMIGRECG